MSKSVEDIVPRDWNRLQIKNLAWSLNQVATDSIAQELIGLTDEERRRLRFAARQLEVVAHLRNVKQYPADLESLESLKQALGGLILNDSEQRTLSWLATGDGEQVYTMCGLFARLRTTPAPMGDRVLIRSTEHDRWWYPGARGYTGDVREAGLFARDEAIRLIAGNKQHKVVEPVALQKVDLAALVGRLLGAPNLPVPLSGPAFLAAARPDGRSIFTEEAERQAVADAFPDDPTPPLSAAPQGDTTGGG